MLGHDWTTACTNWLRRGHTRGSWRARARDGPESFSYGASGCNFFVAVWRTPEITFLFLKKKQSHNHSHAHPKWPEWFNGCVGVPGATGPVCSADGDGGGEGGRLAESSTAKGERERERETRKTGHGWEVGHSNAHRVCLWRKIPCSSRATSDDGGCR